MGEGLGEGLFLRFVSWKQEREEGDHWLTGSPEELSGFQTETSPIKVTPLPLHA